jgi:uncharacterized delta-60 repeat protein
MGRTGGPSAFAVGVIMNIFRSLFALSLIALAASLHAAPAGQLDTSFGGLGTGSRTIGFDAISGDKNDLGTAIAKGPDGRLYSFGTVSTGLNQRSLGIIRSSPDGVPDPTFGAQGKLTLLPPAFSSIWISDAAFTPTGRLVVAGYASLAGSTEQGLVVCALKTDGTLDTVFGQSPATPGCRHVVPAANASAFGLAMVVLPDSRIAVAGYTTDNLGTRGLVVQLDSQGKPDSSVYLNGIATPFAWMPAHLFNDLALSADGKLLLAGRVIQGGNSDYLVARLSPNGLPDSTFNTNGTKGYQIVGFDEGPSLSDEATAITLLPDGTALVAGDVEVAINQSRLGMVKITVTGEIDNTWQGGKKIYDPCALMATGCNMATHDLRIQSGNRIVLAGALGNPSGAITNDMFAMRLLLNGQLDAAFGTQQPGQTGTAIIPVTARADVASTIHFQGARIVLLGGATPVAANRLDFSMVRLDHGLATQFTVTPAKTGNGTISPDVPKNVVHSGHTSFTLTPGPGNAIASVTGCGGARVGNVYTTGPVTQNCVVEATFKSNVTLTYLADAGGSIEGPTPQVIPYNADGQVVKAIADYGHLFDRWSDGKTGNVRLDQDVQQDVTVVALFKKRPWRLMGTAPAGGGALDPLAIFIPHGEGGFQTLQPDPGFGVASVAGCDGVLAGNAYFVGPMLSDCDFIVSFEPSEAAYALSYLPGAHCAIAGAQHQVVKSGFDGSEVVVTAETGYQFVQWSDGNKNAVRTDTHVFNHLSVTAQCAPLDAQLFVVSTNFGAGGALSPFVDQLVAENQSVQFSVLPAPGYGIGEVEGCEGELTGSVFTTAPVKADCQVTASFMPSNVFYSLHYGIGPGGQQLQGDADQTVISGAAGTAVTAVPMPGRIFVQWSDGRTDNPRQDAHVVANVDVTAQFAEAGSLLVTPSAGIGGTITPALTQAVQPNAVVQFTVTPDVGFAIAGVTGCKGTLEGKQYTTAPVTENCTIQATFVPTNKQYVLKYTAAQNGTVNGQEAVEAVVPSGGGGPVVVAAPAPGYVFLQWSDGLLQDSRTDTGIVADLSVTATFVAEGTVTHVVTASAAGGGTISPSGAQVVLEGESLIFAIEPHPGFVVATVEGCAGTLVGNQYQTGPVTASCNVLATFAPANGQQFSVTYVAGTGGTVNGQAQVQQTVSAGGSGPAVTAAANAGFFFVQWSDGLEQNPRTDTHVADDINVKAIFAANGTAIHTVTPSSGGGGALAPLLPLKVPQGQTAQFEVLPQPGFAVFEVGGSCGGTLIGNAYVTNPVVGSCTVEATFALSDEVFSLSYQAGPGGLVNGVASVQQNVLAGESGPVVQAEPANGFVFVQWSDGSTMNPRQDKNVAADVDVTATFAPQGATIFTVTPIAGVGGGWSPPNPQQVEAGQNAEFIVVPQAGYAVDTVGGTCGGTLVGNVYTTDPVQQDCTVEVTFKDDRIFANDFELPLGP